LPATRYKVWRWGDAVGQGVLAPYHVGVWGIAKAPDNDNPYVVANELVCYNLAKAILLPIPPGFIVARNGAFNYVSLDFNLSGAALPPADPESVIRAVPDIAAGIIAFDVWIVNSDRHDGNLHYDFLQRKIEIFDHGHAFFRGSNEEQARETLANSENQLGIGNHCLASELLELTSIPRWLNRIMAVPDFYISEVIKAGIEVGLPESQAGFCEDFLSRRRQALGELIRNNQDTFPKVQPTLWDNF